MKKTKKLIRSAALALTKVRYGEPPIVVEPVQQPADTTAADEASFEHLCNTLISMYSMEEWAWADSTETLIPLAREDRDYYHASEFRIVEAYSRLHDNHRLIERLKASKVYNRIPQVLEFRTLAIAKGMTAEPPPKPKETQDAFRKRTVHNQHKKAEYDRAVSKAIREALIAYQKELEQDFELGLIDEEEKETLYTQYREGLLNASHEKQRPKAADNWRL